MRIKNEDIRNFLIETFGEEKGSEIFLLPAYSDAFEGLSMTNSAIYNFNKMVILKCVATGLNNIEAENVLEKELRDICEPLGSKAPVINMGTPFIDY